MQTTDSTELITLEDVIKTHKDKLNILKSNRAKAERENWTDSEISECDGMIRVLASILSDLNKVAIITNS